MKIDYSEYLTEKQLDIEERLWLKEGRHESYALAIAQVPMPGKIPAVLEVGCGTGIVASHLPWRVPYVGIDANRFCLSKARARNNAVNLNERRVFIDCDVRVFKPFRKFDIVCAFAFFKHFMPEEWAVVFPKVLSWAPFAVFTMPLAEVDTENGTDGFPHYLASRQTLAEALTKADRWIIHTLDENTIEPIFIVGPTSIRAVHDAQGDPAIHSLDNGA